MRNSMAVAALAMIGGIRTVKDNLGKNETGWVKAKRSPEEHERRIEAARVKRERKAAKRLATA